MEKAIFITNGEQEFNRYIASYLLEKGHRVTLHFTDDEAACIYRLSLERDYPDRFLTLTDTEMSRDSVHLAVEQAAVLMDGLDVLIHGNEMADEEALFEKDPAGLGDFITEQFRRIHLFNREIASRMMKRKSGHLIFPIFYDAIYYAGYPSSPMLNHGKISMMKCLSRELTAFKLTVNAMTFGYYDDGFDRSVKKEKRDVLEIYSLKPTFPLWQEMIPALDILIHPPFKYMSGHDFHIGTGIETNL